MDTLTITHNAGFFSCCSVKLDNIIKYFNTNKKLPKIVDSSKQFNWYKLNENDDDITFKYFDNYDNYNNIEFTKNINYYQYYQFADYSQLNYNDICPFVQKYFSPSLEVKNIITLLEKKYNLDYNNICVLFYRGNDKVTETKLCGYNEYIILAKKILQQNPNIVFFIQSDETEFIEMMLSKFPNNSFYMKDEVRHMKKCVNTVDIVFKNNNIEMFSKAYLAITIIMSKCKYIICGSGNCSIWIMLYRGNVNNVYQHLQNQWIIPNK
jgi:hypothetical protein